MIYYCKRWNDDWRSYSENKNFSCNLIVDVNTQEIEPHDTSILSDWIYECGHNGGDNNRISGRAWWVDTDYLYKVETSVI